MLQLQMSGGPLQRRRLIRKGRKKMKKLDRSELTQEQIELAMDCDSPAALVKLAKERGYEMTEVEAEAYLSELADFKLDSEALKKVAGGGCYSRHTGGEWECKKYCNNRCKDKDISY